MQVKTYFDIDDDIRKFSTNLDLVQDNILEGLRDDSGEFYIFSFDNYNYHSFGYSSDDLSEILDIFADDGILDFRRHNLDETSEEKREKMFENGQLSVCGNFCDWYELESMQVFTVKRSDLLVKLNGNGDIVELEVKNVSHV